MSNTPVFAATCRKCNGWKAVAVDIPEHKDDIAESVSEWIKAGWKIEKITVSDVRTGKIQMCECGSNQGELFEQERQS